MIFGKNNDLCPKYIDIYEFREVRTYSTIFCLLFKNTEKVQEHDLYLNQILHHFDLKNFFKDE